VDDSASYLEWQQLFRILICFHNRNLTPSHRRLNHKYFNTVFYGLQNPSVCAHGFDWRSSAIGFCSSISNDEKKNLSREGREYLGEHFTPHVYFGQIPKTIDEWRRIYDDGDENYLAQLSPTLTFLKRKV
jgi:hypothetical protein